jgi:hypothetical protein
MIPQTFEYSVPATLAEALNMIDIGGTDAFVCQAGDLGDCSPRSVTHLTETPETLSAGIENFEI